jgi:hypothetical protein
VDDAGEAAPLVHHGKSHDSVGFQGMDHGAGELAHVGDPGVDGHDLPNRNVQEPLGLPLHEPRQVTGGDHAHDLRRSGSTIGIVPRIRARGTMQARMGRSGPSEG